MCSLGKIFYTTFFKNVMNENMKTPLFKEIPTMVENIAN